MAEGVGVGLQNGRCKRPRRKDCFVLEEGNKGEGVKRVKLLKERFQMDTYFV